jgi:Ca2+-binding EF-hand superfamily protein
LKERVYKTKIKGKMKSTIIIVLTLTICALSSTVHASNLRRATTSMGKMDQFMALYGDEIKNSPEYKKDPVSYLASFIATTKAKINEEQSELIEDAKRECTGDATVSVKVSGDTKFEERTLSGCTERSVCGARTNKELSIGQKSAQCMTEERLVIDAQNGNLVKAHGRHNQLSKEIKDTKAKRAIANEKYLETLKNHNEALKVLQQILDVLTKKSRHKIADDEPVSLLEKKQVLALARVPEVAPILSFLEKPMEGGKNAERLQKLQAIIKKFIGYLKDSTEALQEKERVAVEEYNQDVEDMEQEIKEEAVKIADASKKLSSGKAENEKCTKTYDEVEKHFAKSTSVCTKSHKIFVRQYKDNVELFALMHEVFGMVKGKVRGKVKETIEQAAKIQPVSATGGSTGSASTGGASTGGASTGGASTGGASEEPVNLESPKAETGSEEVIVKPQPVLGKWVAVWKNVLKVYDNDGDKHVSYEEIQRRTNGHGPPRAEWRKMAGEDGKLSFNEYTKYMEKYGKRTPPPTPPPSIVIEDQVRKQWAIILKKFDEDRDMKISYKEMVKYQPKGVTGPSVAMWRSIGGDDMRVSYNEYLRYVKKQASSSPPPRKIDPNEGNKEVEAGTGGATGAETGAAPEKEGAETGSSTGAADGEKSPKVAPETESPKAETGAETGSSTGAADGEKSPKVAPKPGATGVVITPEPVPVLVPGQSGAAPEQESPKAETGASTGSAEPEAKPLVWDKIKRLYDENKDNKISWAELIAAAPKLNTLRMKTIFIKIAGPKGLASYNDYLKFVIHAKKVPDAPKEPETPSEPMKVEPMEPVTVAPQPMEKHWEKVLRLYDENKDNKVSWSELIKAQPKLNTMEMKAIFNNISKNQGGLASYNDYIQFVKRSEEVKPMARPMMMDRRL